VPRRARSRTVLLAQMKDATTGSILAGLSANLNSIPKPLGQNFTYDQGKELARHHELAAATGGSVYFWDPHSPWRHGICENTNELLRYYLSYIGTDLSVYIGGELGAIADSLDSRPAATQAFHAPSEAFAAALVSANQPQAAKH
jgi:IS30 family transposase